MPTLTEVRRYIDAATLSLAAEEDKLSNQHYYQWSEAEIRKIREKREFWHNSKLYWIREYEKLTGKPGFTPIEPVVIVVKSPQRLAEEKKQADEKKKALDKLWYGLGLAESSLFRLKGRRDDLARQGSSFMGVTAIVLGGGSGATLIAIEHQVIRPAQKLLQDANEAYRKRQYEKAASLTESALGKIRAGEAVLSEYLGQIDTGCGRAIAVIKIWSVAATAGLDGGVASEMVQQGAFEVTTLVAEGTTGGNVSAGDVATSIFNVASAGAAAKIGDWGKQVLGKQVFKYLAGKGLVGAASEKAIKEAVGDFCSNNLKVAAEFGLNVVKNKPLDQTGLNFLTVIVALGTGRAGKPLPEGEVRDMVLKDLGLVQ